MLMHAEKQKKIVENNKTKFQIPKTMFFKIIMKLYWSCRSFANCESQSNIDIDLHMRHGAEMK